MSHLHSNIIYIICNNIKYFAAGMFNLWWFNGLTSKMQLVVFWHLRYFLWVVVLKTFINSSMNCKECLLTFYFQNVTKNTRPFIRCDLLWLLLYLFNITPKTVSFHHSKQNTFALSQYFDSDAIQKFCNKFLQTFLYIFKNISHLSHNQWFRCWRSIVVVVFYC